MTRVTAIGTVLAAALWMAPANTPLADESVHVSGRFGSQGQGKRPHRSDQRAPKFSQRHHNRRHHPLDRGPEYSHGVPFMRRQERSRTYGERDRYVISPGCRPVAVRSYDRYGQLVLRYTTVCYDRFGRHYYPGGRPRKR